MSLMSYAAGLSCLCVDADLGLGSGAKSYSFVGRRGSSSRHPSHMYLLCIHKRVHAHKFQVSMFRVRSGMGPLLPYHRV